MAPDRIGRGTLNRTTRFFATALRIAVLALLVGIGHPWGAPAADDGGAPLLFVGPTGARPLIYLENGIPAGILADIVFEIEKHLRRPIDVRVLDFRQARRLVRHGEADAVMPMSIVPERSQQFDLSYPLFDVVFTVFAREKEHFPPEWPNRKGVRVGVFEKGLSAVLARKRYPKATLVTVRGSANAMRLVQRSEIDAMVTTRRTGFQVIVDNKIGNVAALPITLLRTPTGIAVRKGNRELVETLNEAIGKLEKDGRIEEILSAWESTRILIIPKRQVWFTATLVVIGVAVVFLAVSAFYVHRLRTANRRLQHDIAEREQAEDALRESEARFSKVFHSSPAAISIVGLEDGLLYSVNDRWLALLGYERAEVIGKTVKDLGIWADYSERPNFVERLLRDGSIREFEAGFVAKSGKQGIMVMAGETIELGGERRLLIVFNDISDRRKAEETLRETKAQLDIAVESFSGGFLLLDADDRLVFANEALMDTHPRMREIQVPGVSFETIVRDLAAIGIYGNTPEEIEKTVQARLRHHRTNTPFEYRMLDGRWFQMEEYGTRDGGTALVRIDVTERKQAEENAARAQARLNDAIESTSQAFALFDADDRFVLCNERYREGMPEARDILIPGVSFEQIIRRRMEHHFQADDPMGAEEMVRRRMAHHRTGSGPFEYCRRDGRWLEINDYRTSDGGTVVIGAEITSRKLIEQALAQSEERFRVTSETANDAIISADEEGRITFWNTSAERVFGYRQKEILGKPVTKLIPKQFRSSHRKGFKRAVEAPEIDLAGAPREETGITKDGHEVSIEITVSRWEAGGRRFFTGIIRDISERKAMQAQLLQSQKMEAVGHLSGGIAHDFNNIIQIVMTNLELLRGNVEGDAAGQALLERGLAAGRRGSDLTRQLLSFARDQPLDHAFLDPNDLINDMISLMQGTLGEPIEIRPDLDARCRPMSVDRNAFENAILNLALNARDAMPKGGVLTISTRPLNVGGRGGGGLSPGDYVEIVFEDTGTGMPADVAGMAFDPFFSTKPVGKGSGLGLSMVYGFCKQSGGHAWLQSEVGTGTKVGMVFAADRRHKARDDNSKPGTEGVDTARFESMRVLLVEDDDDVRLSTLKMLKRFSFDVTEAADAASALGVLEKGEHFDLLLSDVVMPGKISGFDLAKEVTQIRKDIKVLLVSGHTPEEIERHRAKGERFSLMRKPYTGEDLFSALVRILG